MRTYHDTIEERLRRNTLLVTDGVKEANFYKEVAASRLLAKADICAGLFLIAEAILFWHSSHVLWKIFQILVAIVGVLIINAGRLRTNMTYRDFVLNRIVPLARLFKERDKSMEVSLPARWVFLSSDDLRDLEKQFCEQLSNDFRKLERIRKNERRDVRNNKLKAELVAVVETSHLSSDEQVELKSELLEIWDSLSQNPERRKSFVLKVRNALLFQPFVVKTEGQGKESVDSVSEEVKKSQSQTDWRLQLLETEARECVTDSALQLYTQALEEKDRRVRVRLLGRAIRAERETEDAQPKPLESSTHITVAKSSEVAFIRLDQLMEDKFQIAHLIPTSVDRGMVKAILLELLDPGSMQRRFQSAYRPESRLKRRTEQRYRSWNDKPFDLRSFYTGLAWLVDEGVVQEKRKRNKKKREDMYSLYANTLSAKSASAKELITAVIRLDREIRSG